MLIVWSLADGSTDPFYVKFTTPKQTSLIIGSSRAAQCLQPDIINQILKEGTLYNYAFSRVHTPYGEAYFKSIKEKLNTHAKQGVFIIEVNPWSISDKFVSPDSSQNHSFLSKIKHVDRHPNFEYLLKAFDQRNIKIISNRLLNKKENGFFITNTGWLDVRLEQGMDSRHQLTKQTINQYKKIRLEYSGLSQTGLNYLKKTINFLKAHGAVYLVRLPVHDDMLNIENELLPDFDFRMLSLSKTCHVEYINFMPQRTEFEYTDGHHLIKVSSNLLSQHIAELIKNSKH